MNIAIGDEVYFNSTPSQSNHDLFWKVIDKNEQAGQLIIRLDEMGFTDLRWVINIKQVRQYNAINRKDSHVVVFSSIKNSIINCVICLC